MKLLRRDDEGASLLYIAKTSKSMKKIIIRILFITKSSNSIRFNDN